MSLCTSGVSRRRSHQGAGRVEAGPGRSCSTQTVARAPAPVQVRPPPGAEETRRRGDLGRWRGTGGGVTVPLPESCMWLALAGRLKPRLSIPGDRTPACMWMSFQPSVPQSCPTPCDPRDCSPQSSSVQWILQTRVGCHVVL